MVGIDSRTQAAGAGRERCRGKSQQTRDAGGRWSLHTGVLLKRMEGLGQARAVRADVAFGGADCAHAREVNRRALIWELRGASSNDSGMPRGGTADSSARSRQGGGHGRARATQHQVLRQRFNEPAAHRGVLVVRSVSLIAGYLALGLRAVPHSCGSDSRARSIRDCRPAWKPVSLPTAVRYCWQAKAALIATGVAY